jgi:hypothetical protein
MAEVFSDDLNLNIGDLLLNPLYHATSKHRARLFMLMHVCARATSKLCASLTSAPIVASNLSQTVSHLFQRWRGKAGGPHQLVVNMEDLAGPHAVPIRIPRVAARRQPYAR